MKSAYRWSAINAKDVVPWAELVNHLAVVDGTEEFYNADDLLDELNAPRMDTLRDTFAVWYDDSMIAFGTVRVPSHPDHHGGKVDVGLDGGVHSHHRGKGLGTLLMQKLEARGRELSAERHPGVPFYLSTGGGLEDSSARRFHHSRGYSVARYFNLLSRDLGAQDSAETILGGRNVPPGLSIRAPQDADEPAVMAAHTAAFVDHWGSAPPAADQWHQNWIAGSNRPEVSRIAVDEAGVVAPQGTVLAYSLCGQWVTRELYVNLVGTVPEARGKGLGSAVLAHTIEAAARSGEFDVIELDVDSESLTGATRLYERLGFTLKLTQAAMRRSAD
ncbi:GNAT family N-acetyltransferase [Nesterenkonia sandarakina]|uniref:Ribosomal protein S18 acetylase RimI-like enzyme n=1 Tax=Nesterenkonia sandarakina TaxID=272918 RepID=A0A2T0YR12_9MICC|nr:GNAT family N-acetyltransferase [Nesterenkonia sandarakina]PRZ17852.1 ribosomal protein S18 acetylase RimI-like enzyme [Nesterenkonia sandarakina]